jgi:hypothetical protein
MSQLKKVLLLLLAVVLASCSLGQHPETDGGALRLLDPRLGPAPVLLKQSVTLEVRGRQQQFIALSRLTAERSRVAALLPTGQQLLYLDYDGRQLTQEAISSIELPGEDILALMQFVLWPGPALLNSYQAESGWRAEVSQQQRRLIYKDRLLLDVSYGEWQVSVDNRLHGYRLTIRTIEQREIEP